MKQIGYEWKKVMSGNEIAAMLEKNGWKFIHQTGSHMKYEKNKIPCMVPNHKEIKRGTLASIKRTISLAELMI